MTSVAPTARESRFGHDPEHSATLPGHYYMDRTIFERENEEIWFKTWQFVGYLHDLEGPGDYITTTLLDQPLFVVRARDGNLRAFYNVCMHRGHILLEGTGHTRMITCPFHAWTYDLEGNLMAAGNSENVAGFDAGEFCLPEIQVEEFLHIAFVNLDVGAPSLASQAGGLEREIRATVPQFEQLKLARHDPFVLKCNWKFIFDGMECYHCPHIHPGVFDGKKPELRESIEHDVWATHISYGDGEVTRHQRDKLPYELDADDALQNVYIWWLWPNLIFVPPRGRATSRSCTFAPTASSARSWGSTTSS